MGNVDNIYVFKDTEELCRLNDTRNYDAFNGAFFR